MTWEQQLNDARQEFKTSQEASAMLKELYKASIYCTGPISSVQHGERMKAVEQVIVELQQKGK